MSQRANPLEDDLAARYGNSLTQLRAALAVGGGTPKPTATPAACRPNITLVRECRDRGGTWDSETCSCN